jgi:hypothetical protein
MASNNYSASAQLGFGLGDGDALGQQLALSEEERKKKLMQASGPNPALYGDSLITSASDLLLGPGMRASGRRG